MVPVYIFPLSILSLFFVRLELNLAYSIHVPQSEALNGKAPSNTQTMEIGDLSSTIDHQSAILRVCRKYHHTPL